VLPVTPDAAALALPPWTCRVRAVVRLARTREGTRARAAARPAGFAVVDYADTPVGPYREALVAVVTRPLSVTRPFAGRVPWMVVDSAPSVAAGRAHWGLPKQLAALDVGPAGTGALTEASVDGGAARVRLWARALGPAVPLVVRAVLRQPERGPAPVRFRGRARLATVELRGELPCGLRPGWLPGLALDGVLVIESPRT